MTPWWVGQPCPFCARDCDTDASVVALHWQPSAEAQQVTRDTSKQAQHSPWNETNTKLHSLNNSVNDHLSPRSQALVPRIAWRQSPFGYKAQLCVSKALYHERQFFFLCLCFGRDCYRWTGTGIEGERQGRPYFCFCTLVFCNPMFCICQVLVVHLFRIVSDN